ncbi:probable RNA-directed DNA polymerase from transposon X-element [Trichonephila clavipes]|nr:probable RNA-directed DNA polymerase from transposon X-element [Trichonephila clavipes]
MRDFIDKHAPDIFLIQETHLRPEHSFKIPNYSCYRNDRTHPTPGWGGTALLIKNCISHYHIPTPPQYTGVEMTLIMLTPIDHEPIQIGSTYIPPANEHFRNLNVALDPIFNSNNMTILVGDFNAKHTSWGCPVSDTRGNRLYQYIINNNIEVIAPPTPTRFGTASTTIIDYALIKNLNWPCNIDSIPELSSDHNPIKLHFPRTAKFEIPPPQLNTNWNIFTSTLANSENCHLPNATSTPEIESQVRDLTNEILAAHAKASRPMTHSEPPFVQVQYRQQVWEDYLTSLDAEDGSLWGTARAFRKKASPISALNGPNGVALSDTNKTELIALSLESKFQLNDIHNPQKDDIITNTVDAYIANHTNNNNIDPIPPRSSLGTDYLH